MSEATEKAPDSDAPDHQTLIRDIAVLQVKLIFDGFRDFLLVPISLLVGLVDLFQPGMPAGKHFYSLLHMGKRSERWINLFGAAGRIPETRYDNDPYKDEDIDSLVTRIESFVVDEYREGRVTRQAKEKLDRALDALHRQASRQSRNSGG